MGAPGALGENYLVDFYRFLVYNRGYNGKLWTESPMKTASVRRLLCKAFGHETWPEFKQHLVEAKHPYGGTISWRAIAIAKRRSSAGCIITESGLEDPNVDTWRTLEQFTYVRFKGSTNIFRYRNEAELVVHIKYFDDTRLTELEGGDQFTLEPMTTARSHAYAQERRDAIANGTWKVKPRGPNPNMRRPSIHHYRPY